MATLSEMLNSIQTQLATLALRLADSECKTTAPGAPLSGEDWDDICSSFPAGFGPAWTKNIHSKIDAVLAKRNTAQPIPPQSQQDAETCALWRKVQVERSAERTTQICGNLAEKAYNAFMRASDKPWDAVVRVIQKDRDARWMESIATEAEEHGVLTGVVGEFIAGAHERIEAPPTLQERITERFKTQRCINSSVWNPAELAAIAVEEIAKEQK